MPAVSVVIPTYNQENNLRRAVESVLRQTYTDYELIIVDDGSTDNTPKVIDEYAKKDNRIKSITQDNSGAPARPTNRAIQECVGKYVAILQHDDEWLPEKLSKQVAFFEDSGNQNYSMVMCDVTVINDFDNAVSQIYFDKQNMQEILVHNIIYFLSFPLIKKEVFDKIGLFDTRFRIMDDYDFWLRFCEEGFCYGKVPELLAIYHARRAGITRGAKNEKWIKDYLLLTEKHKKYFRLYPKSAKKFLKIVWPKFTGRPIALFSLCVNIFSGMNLLFFMPKLCGKICLEYWHKFSLGIE